MRTIPSKNSSARLAWLAADAGCLMLALSAGATAQVRREPDIATTLSQDSSTLGATLFARDGDFLIAGGVVLHGSAAFTLEQDGRALPVRASDVTPLAEPDGRMALHYRGAAYPVGMPAGLACPLGHFVERNGLIAYTVVHFMDDDSPRSLLRAGVVRHRLAREFDGTRFENLLRAADFAAAENLPGTLGSSIAASINADNGIGAYLLTASYGGNDNVGSFVNADFQVTYRVYLMAGAQRVEIAGVPLRYFWQLEHGGGAGVFSVQALSQNWADHAQLSAANAAPTQYDVVNFYQVAGLFRQLDVAAPAVFAKFVEQACQR